MRVRVVNHVKIGSRVLPVKRLTRIAPLLPRLAFEGTAYQLRVLAEETRELLIDRILAGAVQNKVGDNPLAKAVVRRPRVLRFPSMITANRRALPMRPLTRKHVRRKATWHLRSAHRANFRGKRKQFDGRKLVMTGDYIRGIEVYKIEQKESGVAYMVRLEPRKHERLPGWTDTPITLTLLAKTHEYGSARHKIPARPLWRPTARDVHAAFNRLKKNVRAITLRAALRRVA